MTGNVPARAIAGDAATAAPDMATATAGAVRQPEAGRISVPEMPLVSVIISVRNGAATLAEAIESVLAQTYPRVELIIIDAASDDGTVDVIRRYHDRIDFWTSEPDRGIYDAWNKGLARARGEWIAFLGADDAYKPTAIDDYLGILGGDGTADVDFVSSKVELVSHTRRLMRVVGRPWNWREFRVYMNVAHSGSLHHRRLFERYGKYDDTYRITGDYELLLRAGATLRTAYLDKVTAIMRIGGISNANLRVFDESYRAKITTGRRRLLPCLLEKYEALAKYFVRRAVYAVRARWS
jgi:glycosyltransferase involved in cell wall biosynthesis